MAFTWRTRILRILDMVGLRERTSPERDIVIPSTISNNSNSSNTNSNTNNITNSSITSLTVGISSPLHTCPHL